MCQPVTLTGSIRPAPSLGPPTSVQAWLKRQISAGGTLRARSPDSALLLSLREQGAQDPAALRLLRPPKGGQVPRTATHGDHHCHSVTETGMGQRFAAASRPGPGQWAAVARALELYGTQPSACPRAPQDTCQSRGPRASRARGGGRAPPLSFLLQVEVHSEFTLLPSLLCVQTI